MSIHGAKIWFNIPASSLEDHMYGRTTSRKKGAKCVLSTEEEVSVLHFLHRMQEIGHSITITQLKLKVAEHTQTKVRPFAGGDPVGS